MWRYDAWDAITAEGHVIVENVAANRILRAVQVLEQWTKRTFDETPEPILDLLGALDEAGLA